MASGNAGYGGWAWLTIQGDVARGSAGGERGATADGMRLTGLIKALAEAGGDVSAPLRVYSTSMAIGEGAASLAKWRAAGWATEDGQALENRALWEALAKAFAARSGPIRFARGGGKAAPEGPDAFVDAWTNFAHDKVRATGAFTAAIPKLNLQKLLAKYRAYGG